MSLSFGEAYLIGGTVRPSPGECGEVHPKKFRNIAELQITGA
jgi:hypothetical protein